MSICLGRSICSSNLFLETLLELSLPTIYLHKGQPMMKSTLNSWAISVAIHTFFTLMCSAKARETESSSSTFGFTRLLISIPIPSFGIPSGLSSRWMAPPSGSSRTLSQLVFHTQRISP
ncbi:unnamed protein product, partial [Vitis vinifera]